MSDDVDARYQTLFDTLIEGFCTIEVLFDARGKPVDYRFLEINTALEKQTGLRDAQGKRIRELVPDLEEHWFRIYGHIAVTGEPARFENEAKALGRHYEVCAYRVGGADSRKVAILFNDITERKTAQLKMQAQLERMSLLQHITRAIAERQDLPSIFQVVIRTLEERLPVDFGTICAHDPASNEIEVASVGSRSEELASELGMTARARVPIDGDGLSRCLRGQLVHEPDIRAVDFPFAQWQRRSWSRTGPSGCSSWRAAKLRASAAASANSCGSFVSTLASRSSRPNSMAPCKARMTICARPSRL
jgi:hypothetical protein